jgi:hypothetical protein
MPQWLRRTFTYPGKGKIVITFDDSTPRLIKKVEFEDAAGTTSVFDRAAGSITVTVKGKEPVVHKSQPAKIKNKKFVYVFDKDDWEFEIHDDGNVVWKRNVGKAGANEEKVDTKGNPRGAWTDPKGVVTNPTPANGTDEKIDEPKNP